MTSLPEARPHRSRVGRPPRGVNVVARSGRAGRKPEAARAGETTAEAPSRQIRQRRTGTKQEMLIRMFERPKGTTVAEVVAAPGWLPHTVRGAMAEALKKKLGLQVSSEKVEGRGRVYRIRV